MRTPIALLLTLLFVTTSCGGGVDPKEENSAGYSALQQQEYDVALRRFQTSLEVIGDDTSHPHYLKSKLGAIEAQSHLDAGQARIDFLALAKAMPGQVDDRDFYAIGNQMVGADKLDDAIALLGAGLAKYPDSSSLDRLRTQAGKRAEQLANETGNSDLLDKLKGLGYVGN